jgi:hypothetical protein
MKLIIISVIFMLGVMATCSVLTLQPVYFTLPIEYTLEANDEGEKTLKLTYLRMKMRQK